MVESADAAYQAAIAVRIELRHDDALYDLAVDAVNKGWALFKATQDLQDAYRRDQNHGR